MPSPDPLDSPSTTTASNSSYFSYPVKTTISSAFRRLPSNFRSNSSRSSSKSKPTSRDPSQTRTNHDRNHIAPSAQTKRQVPNLIDLQDDDDFGDYTDGSEQNSIAHLPPPGPPPGIAQSYTPSPRATPPPFQPPPLTPLELDGLQNADPQVLNKLVAEEIRLLLPPRLQLVDTWRILFSLERDGSSLKTLYERSEEERGTRGGFVIVVRDSGGGIFGAYLSDPPYPSRGHYYGNGECFLWRSTVLTSHGPLPSFLNLPPPPSEDTTNATRMTTLGSPKNSISEGSGLRPPIMGGTGASTPERIRFKAFPYSGVNDYMIFCEQGFLSVGGGDGHYGLWLDSALERGVSASCPTFGNEALSDEGEKFEVLGCEVWFVGA